MHLAAIGQLVGSSRGRLTSISLISFVIRGVGGQPSTTGAGTGTGAAAGGGGEGGEEEEALEMIK